MQFRVTPFLVPTLVGILLCSPSPFLPRSDASVNPADLDALKQLFQKDPATAFEKSWRLFEEPKRNGNLDGMMEIIRVVSPEAERCVYAKVLDDMIDAAVPVAKKDGNWKVLGDLYCARVRVWQAHGVFWQSYPCGYLQRAWTFAQLARQAYERAGVLLDQVPSTQTPKDWGDGQDADSVRKKCPEYAEAILAIGQAYSEGRDAEAVALTQQLLQQIPREEVGKKNYVFHRVAGVLDLRGGERLLPIMINHVLQICTEAPKANIINTTPYFLAVGCAVAWGGRDDGFLRCYNWITQNLDYLHELAPVDVYLTTFAIKLRDFRRETEANQLQRRVLFLMSRIPDESLKDRWDLGLGFFFAGQIGPDTPPDIRRGLVRHACRTFVLWADRQSPSIKDMDDLLKDVVRRAAPNQKSIWALETGLQWLDAALRHPTPSIRAEAATKAAAMIEEGGRKDLAEHARTLAAALAQNDPKTLFTCALTTAQSAASDSRWSDVEKQLEPVIANPPETNKALLDATMLLAQAKRNLGKAGEADSYLAKAKSLVGQVGLSAGERVSYLMTFADGAADKAEKARLLEQAKQAASEAGLEVMQESITNQLTELAMETGNLAVAKQSLLNLINQKESKREHLAFDPLLRQQWFGENLGTYRKLLQVCAQTNDATTALWCGEQMRARALRDQLAWQKVDMAVQLPANLRKRFEQLRKQRSETYALLRQATGMPVEGVDSEAGDETRGFYIPIRGFYIPIRGPLADAAKATEDSKLLKKKLDELTHEEGALEALIRDAVPAYRMAATSEQLDASALLQRIPLTCGLLQYTLTPEGLVMVGVGPGRRTLVKQINVKPEDLLKQVAEMRRRIVEQSKNVDELGTWWYKVLVLPFEELIKGSRQVMIVADGALQLLPFAALQDAEKHYLAEQYRLVSAPSIEVATLLRTQSNIPQPSKSALIVAAPKLSQMDTGDASTSKDERGFYMPIRGFYMPIRGPYIPIRSEGGISSAFESLSWIPLPGARAEGEKVAKRFPDATLLTGAEATKDRIAQDAGKYRVLHFATHGYADPEAPEFSGLLFAAEEDSRKAAETQRDFEVLTAQQAYLWHLNADLVTLSACETGLGKDIQGEGLMGLTRAFLYAGAKDVVCSLWSVADESTAQLMDRFYAEWQKIPDAGKALQSAQLALMQNEKTRHPFYWAAFVAVQGPR